jgi:hypothetical protein
MDNYGDAEPSVIFADQPCTGSWSFFHSNMKYADGAVDGVGLTTPGHYAYLYTTPYY